MVTLRQLKFFNKVVETRNITQAAEQLHIAQPALGTQVRELEAELGVSLLTRHSRGVEPTPAGLLLQDRSNAIFDILNRTAVDIRRMAAGAPHKFDLGLTTSLMLLIGPDLMLSALQRHPSVSVRLHENASYMQVDALGRKEIDAALAYCVERRSGIDCVPVLKEQLLFVTKAGSDVLNERDSIDLADVLRAELVLGNERDVARRLVTSAAQQFGVPVRLKFETQSIAALRELVLRGAAAAVLPYGSIFRDVERGDLRARRIVNPPIFMTLYILRRSGAREPEELASTVSSILADCVDMLARRLGTMAIKL